MALRAALDCRSFPPWIPVQCCLCAGRWGHSSETRRLGMPAQMGVKEVGPESQGCLAIFGDTGSNGLLMACLFHSSSPTVHYPHSSQSNVSKCEPDHAYNLHWLPTALGITSSTSPCSLGPSGPPAFFLALNAPSWLLPGAFSPALGPGGLCSLTSCVWVHPGLLVLPPRPLGVLSVAVPWSATLLHPSQPENTENRATRACLVSPADEDLTE